MAIDRVVVKQTAKDVVSALYLHFFPKVSAEVVLTEVNEKFEEDGVTPARNEYGKVDYEPAGGRYSLLVADRPTIEQLMGRAAFVLVRAAFDAAAASQGGPALTDAQVGQVLQQLAARGIDMHHALVTPAEELAADHWDGTPTAAHYRSWD